MTIEQIIIDYFRGEMLHGYGLVVFAGVMMLISLTMQIWKKTPFWKGVFIPTVLIGMVLIIMGGRLVNTSEKTLEMVNAVQNGDLETIENEVYRMQEVQANFNAIRYTEATIFLIGALIIFFTVRVSPFWAGFGFSLVVLSILSAALDVPSQRAGASYALEIERYLLMLRGAL
jgi:small-conductance mechanosensitive channel